MRTFCRLLRRGQTRRGRGVCRRAAPRPSCRGDPTRPRQLVPRPTPQVPAALLRCACAVAPARVCARRGAAPPGTRHARAANAGALGARAGLGAALPARRALERRVRRRHGGRGRRAAGAAAGGSAKGDVARAAVRARPGARTPTLPPPNDSQPAAYRLVYQMRHIALRVGRFSPARGWGACGGPKDAVLMAQRAEKRQRICSRHGRGAAACAQTLRTACTARDGGIIPAIVPSGVVLCVGPRLCADALKRTEARLTAALRRHRRVARRR